jgi:transcription antitermination protein NusB
MPLPRKKFREFVLQILYTSNFQRVEDFPKEEDEEFISFMMSILKTTRKNVREVCERISAIGKQLNVIDEKIRKNAEEAYLFDRISKVELNVLRLGLFELLYDKTIPPKVALSEAIRLCKKFGNIDSDKFINAILDCEYKKFDLK